MSKKPDFATKVKKALTELNTEEKAKFSAGTIKTSLTIESQLFFDIKQIALTRKMTGIKPNTVRGIIGEALQNFVKKERKM